MSCLPGGPRGPSVRLPGSTPPRGRTGPGTTNRRHPPTRLFLQRGVDGGGSSGGCRRPEGSGVELNHIGHRGLGLQLNDP